MAKLSVYGTRLRVALLICTVYCHYSWAQQHQLTVYITDADSLRIKNELQLRTSFSSFEECSRYLLALPDVLHANGYIASSIDSVYSSGTQTRLWLFTGLRYHSIELRITPADQTFIKQLPSLPRTAYKDHLTFEEFKFLSGRILDHFENTGYPFAKVTLDSVSIQEKNINASLKIERGVIYRIDSIRVSGGARISGNFIHRFLDIKRGSLYNKARLIDIDQRLLELPYLSQTAPWTVTMVNTGSSVNLFLQPKKSNQIDVLAGFLPASQQVGGKLLFTVDANAQLQNALGGGEKMSLVWQQIQPKSPRLHLGFTQPYFFNSSFGLDALFELYKKDSAFLNVTGELGMAYSLQSGKTVKVFAQTRQTNSLQIDTLAVKTRRLLPDVADVSSFNFGLSYDVTNTNYRFNPTSGYNIFFSLFAGDKRIRKNTTIVQLKDAGFDYGTLYDSLKLKTYQFKSRVAADYYVRLGTHSALRTGLNAGWYQSENYFRNELFQIGGYRLLRGFDEESIFTNRYAVGTLEYRYLLGANSNFFVFTDLGYTDNKVIRQKNTYIGGGLGVSLETKGGILNFSYAAGKRNDLSLNLKQSKIHIGLINVF